MPHHHVTPKVSETAPADRRALLEAAFAALRAEFGLEDGYPEAAVADAERGSEARSMALGTRETASVSACRKERFEL